MRRVVWPTILAFMALSGLASARDARDAWTTSWASAQQVPTSENVAPPSMLHDATLRQVVHLSRGGPTIRVLLSNRFGDAPLRIDDARVARARAPGSSAIVADTDHPLTIGGRRDIVIAPGAEMFSDPVPLTVAPGANLAISVHLLDAPQPQTSHSAARSSSFVVAGSHARDTDLTNAVTTKHWFHLAGVDVAAAAPVVVAIGDSITDGYASGDDANARWPDALAARLRADPKHADWGVANLGISGNRVLADGLGPSLVSRFDRDVFGQRGVRAAIVMEGVNDLGVMTREAEQPVSVHAAMVAKIKAAYRAMAARARAHGVVLAGGTITPFVGSDYYHPGPATEADRQAINHFIRTAGIFPVVIDFDAVLRDPAHPDRLDPRYDSGDHLHPSPTGYRAMAAAVPMSLFDAAKKRNDAVVARRAGPPRPGITRPRASIAAHAMPILGSRR